jgi:NitT/TauT family transport system substrate-binding protein
MKTKIIRVAAFLLAAALILSIAACNRNRAASGGRTYKYGKINLPGKDGALCGAPIYIALEKGFFAEEGFDVTLISADTETRKIGLNNGNIPMVNGDFQFFPSIEEGVNVRVVDGLHKGCIKFVVLPNSNIRTVEDFRGKKIGVDEIGGTPHQVASVWLEKAGISAKPQDRDVEFLPYSDGNLELEALYSGQIDIAAMWDPLGSIAEKSGRVRVVFDLTTDPIFADHYCCYLYASSKIINENPEMISALLRAYRKAQDWISKNPVEAVEIISSKKYSAIEDIPLAVELITHYAYPGQHQHGTAEYDVEADVTYFATALYDIGYLKTEPAQFVRNAYYRVDLNLGR